MLLFVVVDLVPSQTWSNPRELCMTSGTEPFGTRPPFLTAASSTSFAMADMVATLASFAALNAAWDNIIKVLVHRWKLLFCSCAVFLCEESCCRRVLSDELLLRLCKSRCRWDLLSCREVTSCSVSLKEGGTTRLRLSPMRFCERPTPAVALWERR
jgi:hypothetical protein